jgi:hypothetical protein
MRLPKAPEASERRKVIFILLAWVVWAVVLIVSYGAFFA